MDSKFSYDESFDKNLQFNNVFVWQRLKFSAPENCCSQHNPFLIYRFSAFTQNEIILLKIDYISQTPTPREGGGLWERVD